MHALTNRHSAYMPTDRCDEGTTASELLHKTGLILAIATADSLWSWSLHLPTFFLDLY